MQSGVYPRPDRGATQLLQEYELTNSKRSSNVLFWGGMEKASGIRLNVDNADLAIAQRLDPLMGLTPPQRRFCEAYMRTGNASESARQAGYARSSARVTGTRLLQREDVQRALQELWIAQAISAGMTVDRLVAELAVVAMDREHKDQLKAIDMLMRHLGAYNDRLQISLDDPDIIEAAQRYGVDPNELVQEMAQLAPIDTGQS